MATFNGLTLKSDSCLVRDIDIDIRESKGPVISDFETETDDYFAVDKLQEKSKWQIIKKSKSTLVNLLCMIMVWVSASFCYYLIQYQLKYIKGDLYINGLVSSFSEVCAYTLSGILMKALGIKNILVLSYALAITGMMSLILVNT